ncbi:MAG: hypothetical protein IJ849_05925 [Selenomonadaceae bacterium]|nr:hypothetical protein [Selenomonadaceae bacterium]
MGGKVLPLPSDRFVRMGEKIGEKRGQKQGEDRLAKLINTLLGAGRAQEIPIVTTNEERRQELYREYGIA